MGGNSVEGSTAPHRTGVWVRTLIKGTSQEGRTLVVKRHPFGTANENCRLSEKSPCNHYCSPQDCK